MRVHLEFMLATCGGFGIVLRSDDSQMCICITNTPLRGPLRGLANASSLEHEQERGEVPPLLSCTSPPWTTSVRVDQDQGAFRRPRGPHEHRVAGAPRGAVCRSTQFPALH